MYLPIEMRSAEAKESILFVLICNRIVWPEPDDIFLFLYFGWHAILVFQLNKLNISREHCVCWCSLCACNCIRDKWKTEMNKYAKQKWLFSHSLTHHTKHTPAIYSHLHDSSQCSQIYGIMFFSLFKGFIWKIPNPIKR